MFSGDCDRPQKESDSHEEAREITMPGLLSDIPQNIMFPCIGPPGSGPGLLGSKPGAAKSEYLVALEHHATSLKSALAIAASLKSEQNKELDVEVIYDTICDIENGFKSRDSPISRK